MRGFGSSHSSFGAFTERSPHVGVWHVAVQPSFSTVLPSSQDSPGSWSPFPHTAGPPYVKRAISWAVVSVEVTRQPGRLAQLPTSPPANELHPLAILPDAPPPPRVIFPHALPPAPPADPRQLGSMGPKLCARLSILCWHLVADLSTLWITMVRPVPSIPWHFRRAFTLFRSPSKVGESCNSAPLFSSSR